VAARKGQYADMVNKYYDLATSFYEYGEQLDPLSLAMQFVVTLRQQCRQHVQASAEFKA
jgi:hypothetical protein